ncbi:uncharacterized protein PV09_02143 [Verruconis gallopava]|uniref:20S-pre-rRNA D-site endonuclease NOB1 n=1 Tax=Verruconis gallopava TaxID=253628 RepID=A0A0D1XWV9_9PEZI|nr:uncharacterized protein PV09_02143 [Verruconis gallopava]KIW07291.1 hypothetical protein PV09_02143 [Verruconis gallopava]
MVLEKPIHTIVLDAGPIIKGDPSVSSLLAQSEQIVTLPSVIQEIKDEATRTRLQTALLPFLVLRSPKESSVKIISDFARRTGDLSVLSRVDIHLLALAYDLECERNGGDWRLRKSPGAKRISGPKPTTSVSTSLIEETNNESIQPDSSTQDTEPPFTQDETQKAESVSISSQPTSGRGGEGVASNLQEQLENHGETQATPGCTVVSDSQTVELSTLVADIQLSEASQEDSSDSDSEGWITPSNLKKKQEEDTSGNTSAAPEPKVLQVALLTSDFAMQNVALQMNLNLISHSLSRVKYVKTFVLRCHACFNVVKDMSKQFCPRCGKPTLTRVSCSIDQNGQFKLHLKKNMQWNKRGDRYSVPKPVAGAANGRVKGGGKGGWGNDLILAEDQKEYVRAIAEQKRQKQQNFMDEDYLPGILTGDRSGGNRKIKVGAGRNVNSKKRR